MWFEETEEGYLRAFQYTREQIEYFKEVSEFWYDRCTASGSKTLEFTTSATKCFFEYQLIWIDGQSAEICCVKDMEKEGVLSFDLPEGEKQVKVLWMGDSITQGFGPLRSAQTYVSVANRLLNYDIINQGIGGYVYDKNVLMQMYDYHPDKIIISMGTNQFGTETMDEMEEFKGHCSEVYGRNLVLEIQKKGF